MASSREKILNVPTNLITGFLGVGKTSAILNLLEHKPGDERWAVLVNEFGEIGIDGSLVAGQGGTERGIYINEVPGGCMCCAAGLPMQLALNLLLREARPDRLLIEPTGLGHPLEVLQALSTDSYREVLNLQRTLTLVDARKLSDERYTTHPVFLQQLEMADVIVANKDDLYSDEDRAKLRELPGLYCSPDAELIVTQHGRLELSCLEGEPRATYEARDAHSHEAEPLLAADLPFPESGYLVAKNEGDGFESIGWRFHPEKVFDRHRLFTFLTGLGVERMKAVFITTEGIFAYNLTRDALQEFELDDCMESRVEIIADKIDEHWHDALLECLAVS